jgi:hypothetical protein
MGVDFRFAAENASKRIKAQKSVQTSLDSWTATRDLFPVAATPVSVVAFDAFSASPENAMAARSKSDVRPAWP